MESVKTCPKISESEVCRSSDLRGAPLDAMSVEGEPSFHPHQANWTSISRAITSLCEGGFCETSGDGNRLASQIKEHGVVIHELSGGIDIESSEPFDKLRSR